MLNFPNPNRGAPPTLKILVTNDDGISSPGLWALAESLKELGDVTVVAPDRQQSGVGSSITLHNAVRMAPTIFNRDGIKSYAVEGTPGDSVILATEKLVKGPIDLLVSGINTGSNLGNDVFVSGTVGAAFHGFFRGIPSLAVSVTALYNVHFEAAARMAYLLAAKARAGLFPPRALINVNVPNKPLAQLKGVKVTKLSDGSYTEVVDEGSDPRRLHYWINRSKPNWTTQPGTDVYAVERDFISITPLQNDITAHNSLPNLTTLTDDMFHDLRNGQEE